MWLYFSPSEFNIIQYLSKVWHGHWDHAPNRPNINYLPYNNPKGITSQSNIFVGIEILQCDPVEIGKRNWWCLLLKICIDIFPMRDIKGNYLISSTIYSSNHLTKIEIDFHYVNALIFTRNNTSQRTHDAIITSSWRNVIMTLLLRCVSAGS